MKTLDEQIAIMTAYKNGAAIECSYCGGRWTLCTMDVTWDWANFDFRVAAPVRLPATLYLLGGEDGGEWRLAASWEDMRHAVPFREVLPPREDLIKLTCKLNHSALTGLYLHIAGTKFPAGHKHFAGETIDFVEVPK